MKCIIFFIRVVNRLSELSGLAVSVLMPAMVIVLTIEVVARYFFARPTIWVYDTAIFMFGYVGLLSGAYVMKHHGHINVDMVFNLFSPRGRAVLETIFGLLFFYFMGLLIYYCGVAGIDSFMAGDRTATEWGPPLGHFKLMIPVGGILLILQGLANWIQSLYLAINNKELEI